MQSKFKIKPLRWNWEYVSFCMPRTKHNMLQSSKFISLALSIRNLWSEIFIQKLHEIYFTLKMPNWIRIRMSPISVTVRVHVKSFGFFFLLYAISFLLDFITQIKRQMEQWSEQRNLCVMVQKYGVVIARNGVHLHFTIAHINSWMQKILDFTV